MATTVKGEDQSEKTTTADSLEEGSVSLDSLLSPTKSSTDTIAFEKVKGNGIETTETVGVRSSSDFNEVALDDEAGSDPRFSTVPLTAHRNGPSGSSFELEIGGRPKSISSVIISEEGGFGLNGMGETSDRNHKKTPSNFSGNIPFMLARLDSQKSQEDVIGIHRASIDGQIKLQEEFNRLHTQEEEKEKAPDVPITTASVAIDWDFWGSVMSDYQAFASENPEQLAKAIEKGIPHALKGMMWQLMAASKDPELEDTYIKLLKESSTHEKAITRDLSRTFPHHSFFTDGQGIGQENLFNVLKAYSLYDKQVGYCQGLPFIVAVLLLNMPDEEAFCLLVRLMYSYDLRGHFLPEMPKLQLRLFQFDRLVEEMLPVLHVHFLRQGIKSSMYCSQWFLTLFSYRFPLDIVFRIFDTCLASGIEAIFGFSVVLLSKNEETLLKLKFDQILSFLNSKVFDVYLIPPLEDIEANGKNAQHDVNQFVLDAASLRITPFMLDCYLHEYEDMVRARDANAIEIDTLRNSNRSLSMQVKSLESSLAQLNAEHVDALNELVKARLRNEEIEGELVRYKLLYAEVMHKTEDAASGHRKSLAGLFLKRGSS